MRLRSSAGLFLLTLVPAGLATFSARSAAPPARPAPAPAPPRRIDFVKDVQPIFATLCVSCHGPRLQKGGLRLDVKASPLRTGNVLPGKADHSPLLRRVAGLGDEPRMPPKGRPKLTPRQVA